jgi:hypothetical protein
MNLPCCLQEERKHGMCNKKKNNCKVWHDARHGGERKTSGIGPDFISRRGEPFVGFSVVSLCHRINLGAAAVVVVGEMPSVPEHLALLRLPAHIHGLISTCHHAVFNFPDMYM